jgi:hypothetical protein
MGGAAPVEKADGMMSKTCSVCDVVVTYEEL